MKRLSAVCWLCLLAAGAVHAGPKEAAIVAAMRLSEEPNYSWVATVQDDARTYDMIGQTSRGGLTRVKMPLINSVRRRLGRSVTDTQIELIFRGNVDCVLETEKGWVRPDELPMPHESDPELDPIVAGGHVALPGSGSIAGLRGAVIRQRNPRPPPREERHYSNLQLAVSHPHEELAIIIGSHQELHVDGEIVTGTLDDLGAQLLLVRDGQKDITPLRAAGTFKLWMRDGFVARYQVKLEGLLDVAAPNGRRQIVVHQTTHTVVKEIGATRVDVPEPARRKLLR